MKRNRKNRGNRTATRHAPQADQREIGRSADALGHAGNPKQPDAEDQQFTLPLVQQTIAPTQTEEPAGVTTEQAAEAAAGVDTVQQPSEGDAGVINPDFNADEQATFGARLRAARERAGLSREDVAARLKLPLRLIGRLEGNDYATLDHGVFLRGYLISYAKLVNVPVEAAEHAQGCTVEPVTLVATGTVSRSRYLFDRYSVSATYLILTALIVAPAVWLATHGGLQQDLARTAPLDVPNSTSATSGDAQGRSGANTEGATRALSVAPPALDIEPTAREPIIASMAPFPAAAVATEPQVTPIDKPGSHTLTLKLSQASWIEVIGADGSKLEYGLLPAGTERSYHSAKPLSVRIGNTAGVEVEADGEAVDLDPFRHANVARLVLFGTNGVEAPATDN